MGSVLLPLSFFPLQGNLGVAPTLWQSPSLLQPRADVAEQLESAVAVAAALQKIRRGGGESRLAIDVNGSVTAAGVAPYFSKRPGMQRPETLKAIMFGPHGDILPPRREPPLSAEELRKSWRKIPWYLRWGVGDSFRSILKHDNAKVLRCLKYLLSDIQARKSRDKAAMFVTFRKVVSTLAMVLELDSKVPIVGFVVRGDMNDQKWVWMDPEALAAGEDFAEWDSAAFPKDIKIHIPLGVRPERETVIF